ncbi:MAG: hypothetical protein R2942_19775 [Ignavibacteria bacterium]
MLMQIMVFLQAVKGTFSRTTDAGLTWTILPTPTVDWSYLCKSGFTGMRFI